MKHAVATKDVGVITQQQLDASVGNSIAAICPNGYTSHAENQSAHFVSHALGYRFGVTCQMTSHGREPGATIHIQELFQNCRAVGVWSLRPRSLSPCLVFITRAPSVNLGAKTMSNVPRQHVGIFMNGFIWHYSNSRQQVIKETPSQFRLQYPSADTAMFYGSLP
jgi:hypothetical protein